MSSVTGTKQLPIYKGVNEKTTRILYIQRPKGGGSSISLLKLVKGLDKRKFEPIVLFYQDNEFKDKYKQAKIKTICLSDVNPSLYKVNSGVIGLAMLQKIRRLFAYTLPLVLKLIWVIKKHKIDIVHQNIGFDKEAMIASILTGRIQVCHFRLFATIPRTVQYLSRFVDSIVYISESIKSFYLEPHKNLTNKQIVYNPIAPNHLNKSESRKALNSEFSFKASDLLVSNIGRITSWKGQLFFLRSIELLLEKTRNVRVLIVGEPGRNNQDHQYLKCLEDYVNSKALLKQHVIFTGARKDIDLIMSGSDIVVHSAIEPEPFGLVVAEAMAAGTAVIASRDGGVIEIVDEGETGLLVNPTNIREMSQALSSLANSEKQRDALTKYSQQTIASKFSIAKHVDRIQSIYLKSMEKRKHKTVASKFDRQVY